MTSIWNSSWVTKAHPPIHLPNTFLQRADWLRTILDAGDMAVNKADRTLPSESLYSSGEVTQ